MRIQPPWPGNPLSTEELSWALQALANSNSLRVLLKAVEG